MSRSHLCPQPFYPQREEGGVAARQRIEKHEKSSGQPLFTAHEDKADMNRDNNDHAASASSYMFGNSNRP